MNDENENNEPVEEVVSDELAIALSLNLELQDEVEALGTALADKMELVRQLENAALAGTVERAPAGDAELRALAVTVRTAQRAGHPDASKHLDALLTLLGAA
jgi:hypothetical protein